MPNLEGIKKIAAKLNKGDEPGEFHFNTKGRKEIRCSYILNNKMAFTFGLTRSSRAKSIKYHYVPRQMKITKQEYKKLYECPLRKSVYNKKLIESKIV